MSEAREVLVMLLIVALVLCVIGALCSSLIFTISKVECDALADVNPEHEFRWGLWTGCLVKTPSGLWIDSKNMHLIEGVYAR